LLNYDNNNLLDFQIQHLTMTHVQLTTKLSKKGERSS